MDVLLLVIKVVIVMLKNFACILGLMMILSSSVVLAEDMEVKGEYNFETGKIWGFPGYKVLFQVSDPDIAEVFKADNGEIRVRFISPGDVYIKAIFFRIDKTTEEEMYLFHVTGTDTGETAVDRNTFAEEILKLVNEERAKVHLKPLKLADDLCQWANIRAKECVELFSHTRPNGKSGLDIISANKYSIRGENLSLGSTTPEQVMYQWMHSPSHRDNILFPDYTELGVGYYYDEDFMHSRRHYWVQLFGRR